MNHGVFEIEDIVSLVKPITKRYGINQIYLFGSYARGEATEDSDMDFLVFGGDNFKLTMISPIESSSCGEGADSILPLRIFTDFAASAKSWAELLRKGYHIKKMFLHFQKFSFIITCSVLQKRGVNQNERYRFSAEGD